MSNDATVYFDPDSAAFDPDAFATVARRRGYPLRHVDFRRDDRLAGRVPLIVLSWFEDDPADAGNAS